VGDSRGRGISIGEGGASGGGSEEKKLVLKSKGNGGGADQRKSYLKSKFWQAPRNIFPGSNGKHRNQRISLKIRENVKKIRIFIGNVKKT
jgi:hypothetical protein